MPLMKFPKQFKIGGQVFKIILVEELRDVDNEFIFGDFSYNPPEIRIATKMYGEDIPENQIQNTFYHELFHAFQYMFSSDTDEKEAQSYANFFIEYEETKEY